MYKRIKEFYKLPNYFFCERIAFIILHDLTLTAKSEVRLRSFSEKSRNNYKISYNIVLFLGKDLLYFF